MVLMHAADCYWLVPYKNGRPRDDLAVTTVFRPDNDPALVLTRLRHCMPENQYFYFDRERGVSRIY